MYGPRALRVNAVAPGPIITEMWAAGREIPLLADGLERHIALRRRGRREEIAAAVAFLASDDARYVTGQTIAVDGGFQRMVRWADYVRAAHSAFGLTSTLISWLRPVARSAIAASKPSRPIVAVCIASTDTRPSAIIPIDISNSSWK